MAYRSSNRRGRFVPAAALAAASWVVMERSGPVVTGAEINAIPALAACLLVVGGAALASDILFYAASVCEWLKAKIPSGIKGSAGFVTRRRHIWRDIVWFGMGPYWDAERPGGDFRIRVGRAHGRPAGIIEVRGRGVADGAVSSRLKDHTGF